MDKQVFMDKLAKSLIKMNIEYKQEVLDKLWQYMDLLLKENKKYNLTSITDPDNVLKKHFLDSASILNELEFESDANIIDIGTGAGFPGMVMKIFMKENKFTLLDSTLKKITFIQILSARLGIYENLEVIHDRAEDLARIDNHRESYSHVIARAVAPMKILLEYTVPFAKKGGIINCLKGPNYNQEIKEAKNAIDKLGIKVKDITELKIPGLKAQRYLIKIKKVDSTLNKYPRRAGIPKKRPL